MNAIRLVLTLIIAILCAPLSAQGVYSPTLGRFAQSDPNGLGVPVLDHLTFGGRSLSVFDIAPDLRRHHGDGMNTHVAYGSNPLLPRDPTGLFLGSVGWTDSGGRDPFEIVDEYLAEDAGSKRALLERLVGRARTVAYLTTYLASWLPGPVGTAAGVANATLGMPDELKGTWVETAIGWADRFSLTKFASRFIGASISTGIRYAKNGAAGVARQGDGTVAHAVRMGSYDLVNVRRLPDDQLIARPTYYGGAPKGRDGNPVNIHHMNQNPQGPFEEILAEDHWKIRNPLNGLSQQERELFNQARERYWKRMWDEGRFDHLPP